MAAPYPLSFYPRPWTWRRVELLGRPLAACWTLEAANGRVVLRHEAEWHPADSVMQAITEPECAALRARAERAEEALRALLVWADRVARRAGVQMNDPNTGARLAAHELLNGLDARTNAGANRGGDAAAGGDARHRVVAKPADSNPDAADVVSAFFAEKEGR